jgi:1,2-diacylglycerol 3-alpha-glucosyltransferase
MEGQADRLPHVGRTETLSDSPSMVRVALPCTGLGRQRRGFEAFTREVHAALRDEPGIELSVFGGGGELEVGERAVWNLPRTSAAALALSRLTGRGPYFIEQATFFLGFLPHLVSWRPHVVYFADLNFGNACWHWRRLSGQRFRLLFYNGGPTTRPFTRCDLVQQVTPAHFDAAVARGEPAQRMLMLPHGFDLPVDPPRRDAARAEATRRVLGVPERKAMLLSVGMLGTTLKRMEVLVDAVASMGADRPHLVLLGQRTPETPALEARARALLGDGIWLGTWPRERMAHAYEAADAFALLSLDEGFGLAYVEALAAGLSCVAHDNPNTRYILGNHAFLGDTTSLSVTATLIQRALSDLPEEGQRRERHQWAYERFGWNVLAPKYGEMMRACASGQRPAWSEA